jgi:hypothetical protein
MEKKSEERATRVLCGLVELTTANAARPAKRIFRSRKEPEIIAITSYTGRQRYSSDWLLVSHMECPIMVSVRIAGH